MRILVTGGAGFIGSHVVDAYVAAGHDVAVVDDLSTGKADQVNAAAGFYQLSILDEQLADVFEVERPEVVSHQAARASVQESLRDPIAYAQVNVIGSLNVLEQCRRFDVRKMIYASTGGAGYGEPRWLPVTEDHPMDALDPYGASKHHVEHYLMVYKRNYGLEYTVLRYPNVYGPRQDPHGEAGVVAIFAEQLLNGAQPVIYGDGDQKRDFLFVSDVAQANLVTINSPQSGIYNLGTGIGTTVNEIFDRMARLANPAVARKYGPAKPGEVREIALDPGLARAELGWQAQVGLEEGLERTVEFFRGVSVEGKERQAIS